MLKNDVSTSGMIIDIILLIGNFRPSFMKTAHLAVSRFHKKKAWQLPTFPLKSSIIGVRELDFRVRDGNGYCLSTMATRQY